MLHCSFSYSLHGEYLKFITSSQLLFEKYNHMYNIMYLNDIIHSSHFTREEFINYYNQNRDVKIYWNIDEALALVDAEVYCYVGIQTIGIANPRVRYKLSNEMKTKYALNKNYFKGSQSNMESFIKDLEEKFSIYSKMGLEKETFEHICDMEIEELSLKHNLSKL